MSPTTTGETPNVVRLADWRPQATEINLSIMEEAGRNLDGELWESLYRISGRLAIASRALSGGKVNLSATSALLWRLSQSMDEMATQADRLERKLRKAKKRRKRK